VARGLVVGIYPDGTPSAIQDALTAAQVDLSKVKVLVKSSAIGADLDLDSDLTFEDVYEDMEGNSLADDMTRGTGVMGDSGGTNVPGVGGRNQSLGEFSRGGHAKNYVGNLGIPDDEADNFNSAIEEGRAVVAYPDAGDKSAEVVNAFKSAGLRNVRTY